MVKKTSNYRCSGLLIGILSITVILGLILVALTMRKGTLKEGFSSKVSIEYYCMSGCGFCEKFEEVWSRFTEYVDNSSELQFTYKKYNISTSEGAERGKQFNVNSAPTILAIKNDNVIGSMETNRTLENLIEFAEQSSKPTA